MVTESYVLGIDIGTGSTKGVAVDYSGTVMATSQFHYPTLQPAVNYSEQEPEAVWQAFSNCIREVVNQLHHPPAVICLSSAMHSLICVDEKGTALCNLITWADTRSAAIAEEIKDSKAGEAIYRTSGTPIHAMSPLCKIGWIKQNNPELFSNTKKFISIKEYIWFKLFGSFQIDYSIASATGLFDIENLTWNENALKLTGIQTDQLSTPVNTNTIKNNIPSTLATGLGISAETTFMIGASDGCLANVGSFALEPGVAAVTIGTSGAVRMMSPQPIFNFPAMTFNYWLQTDLFVCGGPINNGGNVMTWLLKNFLNKAEPSGEDYTSFFKEVDNVPGGSAGLIFLPYITGERAPVWDARSCGVFFGIKPHHTQAYFLRAAIEGVCYALYDVLQLVEQSATPVHQINVSGGFVHSATWMQLLADVTGKTVCLIQTEDASAIGAAYFALKHMNFVKEFTSFQKKAQATFEPDRKKQAVYKQYFALYKQLYAATSGAMHVLYQIESV